MKASLGRLRESTRKETLTAALEMAEKLNASQKEVLSEFLIHGKYPRKRPHLSNVPYNDDDLFYMQQLCTALLSGLSSRVLELESLKALKVQHEKLKEEFQNMRSGIANATGLHLPENPYAHLDGIFSAEITKKLNVRINDTTLSSRVRNFCLSIDIKTLGQLVQLTPRDLIDKRRCGKRTIAQLSAYLESHNLSWRMYV